MLYIVVFLILRVFLECKSGLICVGAECVICEETCVFTQYCTCFDVYYVSCWMHLCAG